MKQILIVATDEGLSQEVLQALPAPDNVAISQAYTVREACLLVAQQPIDLVLTTVPLAPDLRRALQALQPELELLAVAQNASEAAASSSIAANDLPEALQSALAIAPPASETPATLDETEAAPDLLAQPASPPAQTIPQAQEQSNGHGWPRSDVLERAPWNEKIAGSVLLAGSAIDAVAGALSPEQVEGIVQRVNETWRNDGSALIQFLTLSGQPGKLLLFTRRVGSANSLTLAAIPDYPVGKLRRTADSLARELAGEQGGREVETGEDKSQIVDTNNFHNKPSASGAFALILQTRRPMPAALQASVARALMEVAAESGCELLHQQVGPQIVHIVSTCPEARGSGWLAQLYKQGIEARIQQQFGVEARLWRRGFYATEGERPLTDAELKLFSGS